MMSSEVNEPVLKLRNIVKKFGDFTAVDDVNLDIEEGEFFTIVGPSGSGKTTMIRMLVGMDRPTGGDVILRGKRINDVPASKRPTCMVFQSLALFPHKTVGENIEFPLKIAGVDPVKRKTRAEELMKQLRLPADFYAKGVNQCSGGERQRIALARALAYDPDILFFDEPLSALDFRLRKTLEKELKDIHRETKKTFVYITHSLEEAMVMSDRIGIMNFGKMVQVGTPGEIYNNPNNKFIAQFMGEVNTLAVEGIGKNRVRSLSDGSEFTVSSEPENFKHGSLIIRPEIVKIGKLADDLPNRLKGTVFNDYSLGSRVQYQVRSQSDNYQWLVERLQDEPFDGKLDDLVHIGWRSEDAILVSD
jgi:spermidine/putrescine transport system ATP-binding protein